MLHHRSASNIHKKETKVDIGIGPPVRIMGSVAIQKKWGLLLEKQKEF